MSNSVRDFFWVLWTYLRGRVLRQKAYLPGSYTFRLPATVPLERVIMLMLEWGLPVMTCSEYSRWGAEHGFCRVLALDLSEGEGWRILGNRYDWGKGNWRSNPPILVLSLPEAKPPKRVGRELALALVLTASSGAPSSGAPELPSLRIKRDEPCPDSPYPQGMRHRERSRMLRPQRYRS